MVQKARCFEPILNIMECLANGAVNGLKGQFFVSRIFLSDARPLLTLLDRQFESSFEVGVAAM
jgi:hypothetical protein